MKKRVLLGLKVLVSGLLIWFVLSKVDLDAAIARLLDVAPAMLALAGVAWIAQMLICAVRWRAVMSSIDAALPYPKVLRLWFIGSFFNQVLPSAVGGDAVRIYMGYRAGLSLSQAINGVMLERVAIVVALVLMVTATQPAFLPRVQGPAAEWMLPTVLVLLVAALAGVVLLMTLDRLPSSLHRWRLVRGMVALGGDARRVFLTPRALVRSLGWSLIGHANLTLATFLLARGLDLEVTWLDCMAIVPPVLLIMTLPISIAGWGVREGAMVAGFGFIGVPAEGALVLSLLFGLCGIVVSVPGGLLWLTGDRRLPAAAEAATAEAAPAGDGAAR